MIHPLSDVKTKNIGVDTYVWQYSIILENACIGNNCNINCHVFIENDVIIGNNVTIKSGVYLWDGLRVGNGVFIGPNVTFTNDKYPRSKRYPESFQQVFLGDGCSIGAGATILGGLRVGEWAIVGAGSLVTRPVPSRALVYGNPARIVHWLNYDGSKMEKISSTIFRDSLGDIWMIEDNILKKT